MGFQDMKQNIDVISGEGEQEELRGMDRWEAFNSLVCDLRSDDY